jgi:thiol:disulfide interchange protein
MRYVISFLAMAAVAFGMVFLIQAQDEAKRRSPKLTNDDFISRSPATPGAPPTASNGAIQWENNLDRALSLAKANNRKVIVDVYTDWCGWCKKMDKNIYTDPSVVALSSRYVFVKLDAEDGGQGQRFASQMRVSGYPTTLILDENGRSLQSVPGYPPSIEQFVSTIESAR